MDFKYIKDPNRLKSSTNGKSQVDFNLFYDQYAASIYSFIRSVFACDQQAEKVFSQSMCEIWHSMDLLLVTKKTFYLAAIGLVGKSIYEYLCELQEIEKQTNISSHASSTAEILTASFGRHLLTRKLLSEHVIPLHLNSTSYQKQINPNPTLNRLQWSKRIVEQICFNRHMDTTAKETA